ncbi:MAG: LuxR C-terminal-related transcriptional regulator [Dermatophilaceae bacterium]
MTMPAHPVEVQETIGVAATPAGWLLPRHGLVDRVLSTPAGGLCLLTPAPGYGATTLLAQVEQVWTGASVRIAVRPGDDDRPGRFWHRMLTGLSTCAPAPLETARRLAVAPRVDSIGPALAQEDTDPVPEVIATLASAGPTLVLIDDLDAHRDSRLVGEILELAQSQPPTSRLVVRSRRGWPGRPAHLMSSSRLAVLTTEDLALSPLEAGRVVDHWSPHLAQDERDSLITTCDGWVTALVTALRVHAAGTGPAPTEWLLAGGLDLVLEDELEGLAHRERDLLTGACVLEELTPQICDVVLGSADSHQVLRGLTAAGTWVSHDAERGVWRVHPILSAFLERRLADRSKVSTAHRRAAEWFLAHGDVEAAVRHLLDADEAAAAVAALADNLDVLLESGRAEVVRSCYAALAGAPAPRSTRHLLGAAWAHVFAGRIPEAEHHVHLLLDRVDELDGPGQGAHLSVGPGDSRVDSDIAPGRLAVEVGLLQAHLHGWRGHPTGALAGARQVSAALDEDWTRMSAQSAAFLTARALVWTGRPSEAIELLSAHSRRPGTRIFYTDVSGPSLRALTAAADGRSHRAYALARHAMTALDRVGPLGRLDDCDARLARAMACVDLDRPEDAAVEAETVVSQATAVGHVTYRVLGLVALATARGAQGIREEAARHLEEARLTVREEAPGSCLMGAVDLADLRMSTETGDSERARALLGRVPGGVERGLHALRLEGRGASVDVLRRRVGPTEAPRHAVTARLLLATASASGRPLEAQAQLIAAADLAYEMGLYRALVGWPAHVIVLAERTARERPSDALARLLDAARPKKAPPPFVAGRLTLGDRELLTVLAGAPSVAGVAADLGVSVNTVKTRLRRLYAKLEVHGRDEAVRRARQIGILR